MDVIINGIRYVPARTGNEVKKPFGVLVEEARHRHKESREAASTIFFISSTQLYQIERGHVYPKLKLMQRMLKHYNIDFNDIE